MFKARCHAAAIVIASIAAIVGNAVILAQGGAPQAVARTPDGQPDIQGIWGTDADAADMETGLPDDETATLQGQTVDRSKERSLVIDPPDRRIPYQPWAQQRRMSIPTFRRGEKSRGKPATVRDVRPRTFCLHGTPRNMTTDFQVAQTPDQVILMWEFNHAYRTIRLGNTPALPEAVKLAMGDSRGRWDGNTLVVETSNINDWDWFDYTGTFHSDRMTLLERFTVVDAKTIDYQATVTDPVVFTRPWTYGFQLRRTRMAGDGYEFLEHACVEGERGVDALLKEPK
jgi:hypothetical protein